MRRTVITEDSLRRAMRDDRYWQVQHPERGAYAGWVTKGWQALATSPLRTAAGQSMVSARVPMNGSATAGRSMSPPIPAAGGPDRETPPPRPAPVSSRSSQLGPFLLAPKPPGYIVPRPQEAAPVPMKRVPRQSGKEGAKDTPNWAKGFPRYQGESSTQYAERLLDQKYGGRQNWDKLPSDRGSKSEFSKIRKFGERSFQEMFWDMMLGEHEA